MARPSQEQDRRRQAPSGSGAVSILDNTREIGSLGRTGTVKVDKPKLPLLAANPFTGKDGHETVTSPPFSYPAEVVLMGTAIYLLNKEETLPGVISRADRLSVRLDETELTWLLWSGQKFRAEHQIGEAELETAQKYLLQSIRYLEAHIDDRKALAGIAIPADPEHSFKKRVLKIVGGLNLAQLDDLLKVILEGSLPIKRRPSANPSKLPPFVAR